MADSRVDPHATDAPPNDGVDRYTARDDVVIGSNIGGWPVEVDPFRDERFRSLAHRLQYWALRAAQGGALALPGPLREGVVRGVAALGRTFDGRHTEAARRFIGAALPDASPGEVERLVRESWRHLMRVALVSEGVDRHVKGKRLADHYEVHMHPDVARVLEEKRGSLLITGHMGHWEASCPGVTALGFTPVYAIGKAPRNDFVAQHIQRMREGQGMRLISRYGAMQAVPQAVRAGASVGMLMDHRPRQKPIIAPFFGRPAGCDRSAGVLIRRVGAPLVFYGCYGIPGDDPLKSWRFELRFTRVIFPEDLAGLGPAEIATRVNQELERLLLHRPGQVFWLHDRFKGAPEPGAD